MTQAAPTQTRASLALAIDADGCTLQRLRRVFSYWATAEPTEFGPGLGLPVATSLFAYTRNPGAPAQAAYLDGDRDGLLEAWRRGWIDTLHGLGDFSRSQPCTRDLARRAFETLASDGIRLKVWSNHGGPENVQNLLLAGARGDVPDSPCYLSDLALDYGIRFVWSNELTPVIGQDRESSAGEYYASHAERSAVVRGIARASHGWAERLIRRMRIVPYSGNELSRPQTLRDGRSVSVFRRFGRWRFDTISRLPVILAPAVLDRLAASGGAMCVYLHIGPSADETPETLCAGMKALDEVARRSAEGTLQVLRTSDLLERSRVEGVGAVNAALRRWAWPGGILALALALRLALYTGVQGTDDLLYSSRAWELTRGTFSGGGDLFSTRVAFVFPVALLYFLFGVHAFCLVVVSLASSLLLIGLAWRLGRELYSETVGRGAAIALALLPLDVFYATEGHADLLYAALGALGLFLLWSALRIPECSAGIRRALLAGAALAAAHLAKESAFVLFVPALLWAKDRKAWPRLGAAAGVFAAVVAAELLFYGLRRGDPFLRLHLARAEVQALQVLDEGGFWARAIALPRFFFHPGADGFVYFGALSWPAMAGLIRVLARDRERSGWLALWVAAIAVQIGFWPLTLLPYRPALSLFPRFFIAIALPVALLAAQFLAEPRSRWRSIAAVLLGLLALGCSFQIHREGVRWRQGADWAFAQLSSRPGSLVVANPRSAELLRFLNRYEAPYRIQSYRAGDPAPPPGALLLEDARWESASLAWDADRAPLWWNTLPREPVAEISFPGRWRLRGTRGPEERVALSRVRP